MKNTWYGYLGVVYILVFLLGVAGYCMNIYKLVHLDFEPNYKAEVIRLIGIFPAVGPIAGYITFEEEEDK